MFDWIDKLKRGKEKYPTWADIPPPDNVYNLPAPKLVPPMPEVEPPKEDPARIFYRIGQTDQNRVAFSMGTMEITMNKEGCQNMIDQLTVFMNQIRDEEENEN